MFVFANELPVDYYNPGFFVIESINRRGQLEPTYQFLARQGQQTLSLELKQSKKGRAYVVDAGQNGIFYFRAIAFDRNTRYSGKLISLFRNMPLYRLDPANMSQLERACIENDFYFIGGSGDSPRD